MSKPGDIMVLKHDFKKLDNYGEFKEWLIDQVVIQLLALASVKKVEIDEEQVKSIIENSYGVKPIKPVFELPLYGFILDYYKQVITPYKEGVYIAKNGKIRCEFKYMFISIVDILTSIPELKEYDFSLLDEEYVGFRLATFTQQKKFLGKRTMCNFSNYRIISSDDDLRYMYFKTKADNQTKSIEDIYY